MANARPVLKASGCRPRPPVQVVNSRRLFACLANGTLSCASVSVWPVDVVSFRATPGRPLFRPGSVNTSCSNARPAAERQFRRRRSYLRGKLTSHRR